MYSMKVLFLSGSYAPDKDGVSDYTRILRERLHGRGFDTPVLTTCEAADHLKDPEVQGAVENWKPTSLPRLVGAIQHANPDVLHIQWAPGSYRFNRSLFYLMPLLRASGWHNPVVTTLHEYGNWELHPDWLPDRLDERVKQFGQRRGWWDRETGFLVTGSNRVICTNDNAFHLLYDRLPHILDHLYKIPLGPNICLHRNGSDPRRRLREDFDWPAGAQVVAFFGFVHPVKGLETLFRAFRQVQANRPQARLLVAGGYESLSLPGEEAEDYMDSLLRLLSELGISDQVAFSGFIPDHTASLYLQGADVGVLPFNHGVNLKSGSLLALLEHGLPTIVTRHDPPEPLLEEQKVACLMEPKAPDELASALDRLLSDPVARESYSHAAQDFAQQFSWQRILDDHEALYRGLAG